MSLARDERADLADLLACLTPEQWDAPTRPPDVAVHQRPLEWRCPL